MASYGWGKNHSVEEWLLVETPRFDFYQAVRLLEQLHGSANSVGEHPDPRREAVRFRSKARLDFPASDIQELRRPTAKGEPAELVVNFMGTASWFGPLPGVDAERLLERISRDDNVMRDFLDIFHHRLVSILYRTHKRFQIGLDHRPPDEGHVARTLFSFIGLGTGQLRNRMRVRDRGLLLYAGILAAEHRSMAGLEVILRHYFQVPVEGHPFVGEWYPMGDDQTTVIGRDGRNHMLSATGATLGSRSWSQEAGIELEIGPLRWARFESFLPVNVASVALTELTRFYLGDTLTFQVRLLLDSRDVPQTKLTSEGGARLGWTSWLRTADWVGDGPAVRLSAANLEKTRRVLPPGARRTLEPNVTASAVH